MYSNRDLLLRKDALYESIDMAKKLTDRIGRVGYGVVELFDGDMQLKAVTPFANTITDAGDLYYAQKCIAAIAPASPAAPTAVSGMKLGTGTTAINKGAGTGIALATYKTGSNLAFDATFPSTSNLGVNLGVRDVYKTTWPAGTATDAALTEAVIVNDAATNATTVAANTICRTVFSAQNKGASDTLAITWNHLNLGV